MGRPDIGIDRLKASDDIYHEQFMESFPSASHSKWDDDPCFVFSRVETDSEMCERSGRPDETSWRKTRESQPGFSHEETLQDGTAQSVMDEETHRERLEGDPMSIVKKRHGLNNSSVGMMKQNWNCL